MKKICLLASVLLCVALSVSAILLPVAAVDAPLPEEDDWRADYMGKNDLPLDFDDNPEACYADMFAMLYTTDAFAEDDEPHFKYEDGKLYALDNTILRYNWIMILTPTEEKDVYEISRVGNNIVQGNPAFPDYIEMAENEMILAYTWNGSDGRTGNTKIHSAYVYMTQKIDYFNEIVKAAKPLWVRLDEENNYMYFSKLGFGSVGPEDSDDPDESSTDESSADTAVSSEATVSSEASVSSGSGNTPAPGTNSEASVASTASDASATSEPASDGSSGTTVVLIIVLAVVLVGVVVAIVLVSKKKK